MKSFSILLSLFFLLGFSACKDQKSNTKKDTYEATKPVKLSPRQLSIAKGKGLYKKHCTVCHQPHGKGVGNIYPPLRGSNWLTEKRTESIHAVKYGLQGKIEVNGNTYDNIMLPLGLKDEEVANVLNYVMNAWGNQEDKLVTVEEVSEVKE